MVFKLLTQLMLTGKLKFKQGEIIFAGQSVTLFPLKTIKEMTLDARKNGKRGINKLYFYGWHYGWVFTYAYMKTFKLKPFEETFRLIMDVSSLLGFGDYQTLEFKRKQYSKFKNILNPFGLLFYPSDEKVCHFIRGANAGGGTALHGVIMNGIELECTANNKKYCLFMNVANPLLKEKFKDIIKEQLDLGWLKKKQLALIEQNNLNPEDFLKYE